MFEKIKQANKKTIVISSLIIIVIVAAVGGTFAWLTSKTNLLTNVFTYGDIKISLVETDTNDGDDDLTTNKYVILPGTSIEKDTKVIVEKNSEDCWLFVKIEKENDFDKYMTYEMENKWTPLEGYSDIYYTKVDKKSSEQTINVLKDNKIDVRPELTYADIATLSAYPTMTISAYAVQRNENMDTINDPNKAWLLAYNPAS